MTFEERDGMLWLTQPDLELVASLFNLRVEAAVVGLQPDIALTYASRLLAEGASVNLRRGSAIRRLSLRRPVIPVVPSGLTPATVAIDLVFDTKDIERGRRWLARHEPDFECPRTIYVYEVGPDWYEVDWELTEIPEATLLGYAAKLQAAGLRLPCQVVLPKPLRSMSRRFGPSLESSEPVSYGQLSLGL